jgi:hypothetical protein
MAELPTKLSHEDLVATWKQGVQFEDDGYKDLGFTLQTDVLEAIAKLPLKEREALIDKIIPKTK